MIFRSRLNAFGAIELLEHHHPRQMVRERHFRHGKLPVRQLLEARIHSERRADQEARSAPAASLHGGQRRRQLLRGQLRPLGREHAEPRALWDPRADQLRFLRQPLRDLCGRRIVRQARFRQLDQREVHIAAQTLCIFLRRGEVELFFELADCHIIAVTGSDGKTTTTSIVSEFLKAAGKKVFLGGNIGKPLLPEIESITKDDYAVVELSSFQLISMKESPEIAIVTNVSPNHLDIHKDMQEYVDAKKNILLHQNAFSKTVLNLDNEISNSFSSEVRGQLVKFSRRNTVANGAYLKDNKIVYSDYCKETEIIDIKDIFIPGMHNVENYMAAISAVWGIVDVDTIVKVAKTFQGVEHRAEFVREFNGVKYYNDSIASSPTRTASGTLSLYDEKIIIIAGGYDKNLNYDELGEVICKKVKTLILMGNTADKIETSTKKAPSYSEGNPVIYRVSNMEEAVKKASEVAVKGDIVSLSPASASFDLYKNFMERGIHFKNLVKELK